MLDSFFFCSPQDHTLSEYCTRTLKMTASPFVKVTDEEINCFKENAYFSNNHLCSYTKTIIDLMLVEYRWKKSFYFKDEFERPEA